MGEVGGGGGGGGGVGQEVVYFFTHTGAPLKRIHPEVQGIGTLFKTQCMTCIPCQRQGYLKTIPYPAAHHII